MSDLISRSALIKIIRQEPTDGMFIHEIIEAINELPTVDAVPAVHGEWVFVNDIIPYYRCSKCGVKEEYALAKFCRNCGADMRKKV